MQGFMTIIKASGAIETKELDQAPVFTDLQAAVGGFIEAVPGLQKYGNDDAVAFCNEEGKLQHLPFNYTATKLWACNYGVPVKELGDVLVGDIVVLTGDAEFLEAV